MEGVDVGVYGEAKGEYTRQLSVFLVPVLEGYFLELLQEAKQTAAAPNKALLEFQNLLQKIPDWNQDKVMRETARIQTETKCDYLEELLTAVFIAHTKVLSAIRLTSKQKKLQITIPKIDHFLHRVLMESARSLWTNAFLFAETNSIEKQKNLRQVEHLLQEAILQAIRGLLPVKSILREYLQEDDDEGAEEHTTETAETPAAEATTPSTSATVALPAEEESAPESSEPTPTAPVEEERPILDFTQIQSNLEQPLVAEPPSQPPITQTEQPEQNTIVESPPPTTVAEKPSVQFNEKAQVFSEAGLEEVDLVEDEPPYESLLIEDESLPMDEFEDLDKPAEERAPSPIQFEELPA
jgi:SHS2 domain-containing protein